MAVSLIIDDRKVEAEAGTTILEAAKTAGIRIPTLCHHAALEPYGGCRLCVVEITGRPRLAASCSYIVEEEIEVKTASPRVLKARKLNMELLLLRCPNVPRIRELAEQIGVDEAVLKRFKPDDEKCVLCGLCARVCRERMKVGAIDFVNRGYKREVSTPFGELSPICITCGACEVVCPTGAINLAKITKNKPRPIPSDYNASLTKRGAIYIPFAQAIPKVPVIDRETCMHFLKDVCKSCENFCGPKAINYDQEDEIVDIEAGAVILASGEEIINPALKKELGYARYPNVISSLQFERLLSASGPHMGEVLRPSDLKPPKKIAFIQCVGSRDTTLGKNYCSSVCCTYAIKEAIVAKEHAHDGLETAIFFMDMRTYGKGFDEYYDRAKEEYGVRFIRCRVSEVIETPRTQNLQIHYEDEEGKIISEEFDLVVLSVGLTPAKGVKELAAKLGIELNDYNFCNTTELSPIETNKPGIFVCGAFAGPKDIPETVMQASGAAGKASEILAASRGSLITKKEYPPEVNVTGQEPRVGVFVCHCGVNIGGYVDVPSVVEYIRALPEVAYAEHNLYTCSQDTQQRIVEKIKEHNLNRIVVASCTPRTHEPLFQETIRQAGINKYLFEMANIREQCSWVHMDEREAATEKAKELVKMAVAKVRLHQPLNEFSVGVKQSALIIGGGLSGMIAALSLAKQGFETCIVEREPELGGNLRNLYSTLYSRDTQSYLRDLIEQVKLNEFITVYTNASIKAVSGYIGNFKFVIRLADGNELEYEHGVIIVATGGKEYKPKEYLYGLDKRVVTQLEFEKMLATDSSKAKDYHTIVMIQCVGSRNEERKYCSRICCQQAVKNALKTKEINPEANIFVLYKDMRTYGFAESFYEEARKKGILFIRYEDDKKPELNQDGKRLNLLVTDTLLRQRLSISPDLVVLSAAILPAENQELAKMLKVPLTQDGFFLEAHVKLRPVDFATDGIYLCGLAHSPKTIGESISQALGAAARAAIPLSKGYVEALPIIASVNEEKCVGCGLCVFVCEVKAMKLKPKSEGGKAEVIAASCKGCGACGASCPQQAITIPHFTTEELVAQVDAFAGVT